VGIPFPIAHWQTANAPLAGYALWLNPTYRPGSAYQDAARTTPAAVGDPVGGLYDATTGITATATGAARPTRTATGLTFAGAQLLNAAIGSRAQPETVYLVIRSSAVTGVNTIIDGGTTVNQGRLFYGGGFAYLSLYCGSSFSNTAGVLGALAAIGIVFNGTSSVLRVGNVETTGNPGTNAGSGMLIGGSYGATWGGELREILVYRAAHNASRRAAEIAKAAARCGVAL
jgi:hypothetical protein